jgi:pimeloyl-ACP methyl ester carboxylesterase
MWPSPKKLQLNQDYESNPLAGLSFFDPLGLPRVDVLGFSPGGMVAQVMALKRPALFRRIILTGTDIMIPTVNSFTLSAHLPNAQLIIYADSGHGALFQHAGAYTSHVSEFLERSDALVV